MQVNEYCVYQHINEYGKCLYIGYGDYTRPAQLGGARSDRTNLRSLAHSEFVKNAIQNNFRYWKVIQNKLSKQDAYALEQCFLSIFNPEFNVPVKERCYGIVNQSFDKKSARSKGKKWYTNGKEDKRLFECPESWTNGRSNWSYKEIK